MTRDLRIISFALMLWGIGEGLFIYFHPLYLSQLGADPIQIGGILGLSGIALAITHLPAGALSDTFDRKTILVAAWAAGMLSCFIMFLASSLPIFIAGWVLYSFSGFVLAPMSSYVTSARGTWSVARALTTTNAFYSLGTIAGPLLGGQLAGLLGLRAIYGIATAIFFFSTILVMMLHSQPIDAPIDGPRYRNLLTNKSLGLFLLLSFLSLFAMYFSWPLLPIFLQKERNVSLDLIGLFGSFNAIGMALMGFSLGRLNPRAGLAIVQVLVGASVLLAWKGLGTIWFAMAYLLAAGFRTARSLISAQVENLVRRTEIGLAYGLAETVGAIVYMIASPIAGVFYRLRPDLPFIISLGMILLALILFLRLSPRGLSVIQPAKSEYRRSQIERSNR
jgi:DHA1 family multidrug resistance protein-like MFS transporter